MADWGACVSVGLGSGWFADVRSVSLVVVGGN
jgi:hypothetical protein